MTLTRSSDKSSHARELDAPKTPGGRPRRLLTPSSPSGQVVVPCTRLRVTGGIDDGKTCDLGTEPVGIGTASTNQLALGDPFVSRGHCQIVHQNGQYVVRDLGSTNGTYLNGVRIREAVFSRTDVLTIGHSEITLVESGDVAEHTDPEATFGEMVGGSALMKKFFTSLRSVAPSTLTCLLLGETGTGKELAARALHHESPRRDRPFIVVDCGAIGPQFIEDKLFGHLRGAFTGAHDAAAGVFEEAKGGTVFLDEIGELPLSLQPKLLGVLERREATRIGSHTPVKLDVRIVAATHRDLSEMVQAGSFRQDLLYRLSEYTVRMVALRDRPEDIGMLAQAILEREGYRHRLSDEALCWLKRQSWPGNVRELRNALRRAAVLATSNVIDCGLLEELEPVTSVSSIVTNTEGLTPHLSIAPDANAFELTFEAATEALRRQYVQHLRQRFGNDLQRAGRHAGIHPKSVSRLFRLYGAY